jgi:hypothetical protein
VRTVDLDNPSAGHFGRGATIGHHRWRRFWVTTQGSSSGNSLL